MQYFIGEGGGGISRSEVQEKSSEAQSIIANEKKPKIVLPYKDITWCNIEKVLQACQGYFGQNSLKFAIFTRNCGKN